MKKKFLLIALSLLLVISLFACINESGGEQSESSSNPPEYERPIIDDDITYQPYPELYVESDITVCLHQTYTLNDFVMLGNEKKTDAVITYTSSDLNIVSVNENIVTGVAVGEAVITATCVYGEEVLVKSINVNVLDTRYVAVNGGAKQLELITDTKGYSSIDCNVEVLEFGEKTEDKVSVVTVEDSGVATYADGKLTAVASGKTRLKIQIDAGKKAEYVTIVVYAPISDLQGLAGIQSSGYYALTNDIDVNIPNIGALDIDFNGELNGFGHTITGLAPADGKSVFNNIGKDARIENLSLKGITLGADAAALATENNGTIRNVYIETVLNGGAAIAGTNSGTIENSIVTVLGATAQSAVAVKINSGKLTNVYGIVLNNSMQKVNSLAATNTLDGVVSGRVYASGKEAALSTNFAALGFDAPWETKGLKVPLMFSQFDTNTYSVSGTVTAQAPLTVDYTQEFVITDILDNTLFMFLLTITMKMRR